MPDRSAKHLETREQLRICAPLWRWTGQGNGAGWFFITVNGAAAEALSGTALMRRLEGMGRGFGSLRVQVTIGDTRWQTSVFPMKDGGWLLPVKAAVRKAEQIGEGCEVKATLDF
jgi:hypothetical protein